MRKSARAPSVSAFKAPWNQSSKAFFLAALPIGWAAAAAVFFDASFFPASDLASFLSFLSFLSFFSFLAFFSALTEEPISRRRLFPSARRSKYARRVQVDDDLELESATRQKEKCLAKN